LDSREHFNFVFGNFFKEYKCSLEVGVFEGKQSIIITSPNPQIKYPRVYMGVRIGIRKKVQDLEHRFWNKYGSYTAYVQYKRIEDENILFVRAFNNDYSYPRTFEGVKIHTMTA